MNDAKALATMMCLRLLQRYWTPITPSDTLPYRAVAAVLTDKSDVASYVEPIKLRIVAVTDALAALDDPASGVLVAARHAVHAVAALLDGDYDLAQREHGLAVAMTRDLS